MRGYSRAILVMLLACTRALASDGELQLLADSSEVYVGVPFNVAIDVVATGSVTRPVFPPLEGATVVDNGEPTTTSQRSIQIINGRRTENSTTTTRFLYLVTADREGVLRVPSIEVVADGKKMHTRPRIFRVMKVDTGDLMFVELQASKESVYVGEPVDLVLRIWLLPYNQGRTSLDESDMWSTIDHRRTNWGPFEELINQRPPQVYVSRATRMGEGGERKSYFVYELRKRIWPDKTGAIEGSDVQVMASYPLRIEGRAGFFGNRRITQAKPIVAGVSEPPAIVKPIPTGDRPESYRGAVGPHSITTTAAPTEVRVGDPITLTMLVSGAGRLDLLQSPVLSVIPGFEESFRVAEDQLPGTVDGEQKRFVQSIRALSDKVTEIPPVPLTYFDTDKEEFVTVHSDPIPIKVEAAQRMSAAQIVESVDLNGRASDTLTLVDYGIQGNYTDPSELLEQQGFSLSTAALGSMAVFPCAYLICLAVNRRRHRSAADIAYARRRGAGKQALRKLAAARGQSDPAQQAGQLSAVVLGYVADRFDIPTAGLTRREAVERLKDAGVADDLIRSVDDVLIECETVLFGGAASERMGVLAARSRDAIEQLDRQRF